MFIRNLFIALCLSGFVVTAHLGIADAQVLTPPEQPETKTPVKLQFTGLVTQQKKYSFDVKAVDREYQVQLAPGATVALRLNKPTYDFENRIVRVVRLEPGLDEQHPNASASEPARSSYPLPEKLFVEAKFEHVYQMQRIMQAKVKRINNYVLLAKDPGAEMPTETSLQIRGQLLPADQATTTKLKVNDEEFPVMLGQRDATMQGFTIVDLHPRRTEVFVWGVMGDDNVVIADRIEFQPIIAEP